MVDLEKYIQSVDVEFSESVIKIFNEVETTCFNYNVTPFYEDFIVSLLNNDPIFYHTITLLGGEPEVFNEFVMNDMKNREGLPYDDDIHPYSSQYNRNLNTRTKIIDALLLKAKKYKVNNFNVIEAVFNCYENDYPVYNNSSCFDERLHTSYNTISHIIGKYCDQLWVKLDDIRSELNLLDMCDQQG